MKTEKKYTLPEAIGKFHKTVPLQIDLATTVANKVFAKRKMEIALLDSWLYAFVAVIAGTGLIYTFILVYTASLLSVLVIIIPIIFYFGLSVKEYKLMSERLLSLE
jgi:hypothetical protein